MRAAQPPGHAEVEFAPHVIRVAGGARLHRHPVLWNDARMKDSLSRQHLHGKRIAPEKVASVVAFLFTDGASAINGSTIPVEDGFHIFQNS